MTRKATHPVQKVSEDGFEIAGWSSTDGTADDCRGG